MTDLTWTEDPVGLMEDAGDIGGDVQAGPAFERRFVLGPVTGGDLTEPQYLVVDVAAYASEWPTFVELGKDREGAEYGWDEQTQVTVCTDPSDPGGTEVWADIEYGTGSALTWPTIAEASADARRIIEQMDARMLASPEAAEATVRKHGR